MVYPAVPMLSSVPLSTMRGANATTSPTGIMIPLYTYPTDGTWAAVIQAKRAHPDVPFAAIINPASGPGTSRDPSYAEGIKELQNAGVVVLGYVPTGYATGSDSAIGNLKAQVKAYDRWYEVDGIFFDEMSGVVGHEGYYSTLDSFVKSLGENFTVGNPAATVPAGHIGTLDTLVIYENSGLPDLSKFAYSGYDKSNFAIVAYGMASVARSFVARISGVAGWVYLTDGTLPNPYDSLPGYFEEEVAMLSQVAPAKPKVAADPTGDLGDLDEK